jgi:hypothetical protein
MRTLSTILIWLMTFPVFGQFEVFPTYKLINKDSLTTLNGQQFIKTIKVVSDTIHIDIDFKTYTFVLRHVDNDSKLRYPVFVADFDSKYDIEISTWEIKTMDTEHAIFKLSYTRRHKRQGGQKGKYYTIDNYELDKGKLLGFYVGEMDERQLKKVSVMNIGLVAIIIGATIIGTR